MSALIIRAPRLSDASAITAIHREGLATGHASFRDAPYDWTGFEQSYRSSYGTGYNKSGDWLALVAEQQGQVVAWAGVSGVSDRCVYAGVGEVSVYVAGSAQGRGVGYETLRDLVALSEQRGFWTLTAQVFPENIASLALHEACGFRVLGQRQRIGRMSHGPLTGHWRDTVMLERRSEVVGVE